MMPKRIEHETELCREDATGTELDIPVRVVAWFSPGHPGNPNIESRTCCPPSDAYVEIEAAYQVDGQEIALTRDEEDRIEQDVAQEAFEDEAARLADRADTLRQMRKDGAL